MIRKDGMSTGNQSLGQQSVLDVESKSFIQLSSLKISRSKIHKLKIQYLFSKLIAIVISKLSV